MERDVSPEALRTCGDDSSPSSSSSSSAESSFRELDDVFLQTQTRIWVGEVLQIRLDERMAVSDLLADGELLFEVSKVVWKMLLTQHMEPRHVKAYRNEPFASRKASGRYMPYSNVDSFLKICKILGLAGIDLFSPSDVVEKRDTRKVCICIRSFSRQARSKHLSVPHFDIVTYTVAMPTDMVGCIRRSWELPQCSFLNSASYNLYKDSREKFSQRNTIVNVARSYDMHSEECDGTESNHMVTKSDGLLTKHCYDTTSKVNSDSEICRVFSVVKHGTLAEHILQLHIQNQEKIDCSQCQFESQCTTESVRFLCTQHVERSHQLNSLLFPSSIDSQIHSSGRASHIRSQVKESNEVDGLDLIYNTYSLGYGASVMDDSVNVYTPPGSYFSNQLEISDFFCHRTDGGDTVLYNGENGLRDASTSIVSHCSNLTPGIFENGSRRRLVDIFDVEASSDASMSSVSGAVLNLDLDDRFDVEDNSKTVKFPELQNENAGFWNKKTTGGYTLQDIVKCETTVHSSTSDSEKAHFYMKLDDSGSSTKVFLPYPDQLKVTCHPDHVVSYDNGICMSLVKSDVAYEEDKLYQIDSDALTNVNCTLSCQSHSAFEFNKWDIKGKVASAMALNENAGHAASPESVSLEKTLSGMLAKSSGDALCLEDMKSVVEYNEKEICSSIVANLDPNSKKHQNKFSQGVYLNNIIDGAYDDSDTSANVVAVDVSEKISTSSSIEDGSCFQNLDMTIGDIGAQVKCIPAMLIVDNPSSHHNSVIPANPREPTLHKNSCLTVKCSENVGQKGHQACMYLNDRLHCTEHIDKVNSQDARIDEKVDTLAVEDLGGTRHVNEGTPKSKPQKRLLLKSVVGGTAAFGLLLLLFHFSGVRREKAQSSIESSQTRKANGRGFSSRKGVVQTGFIQLKS